MAESCGEKLGLGSGRVLRYRVLVLVLTFLSYASYHMSRKAPSIVKGALHPHVESSKSKDNWNPVNNPGWAPFSNDLNPSIVGPKGYTISGAKYCEADGSFKCTKEKKATNYYNITYCANYQSENKKFAFRLVQDTDSVQAKSRCTAFDHDNVTAGCWLFHGISANLNPKEHAAICFNQTVNGTKEETDCMIYVQPTGHYIPAPSDDRIGWISRTSNSTTVSVAPVVTNGKVLLGECDTVYLAFYALGLFFSGHIADQVSLRHFLSIGMIGAGIFVVAIGLADAFDIHNMWYFYICYAIQGLFQATGWPAVVAVMGNWFHKETRGLIMGIWNSHTSVGNIMGSLISGAALGLGMHGADWAAAFYLSGGLITFMGVIIFFFLPNHPHDVGLPSLEEEAEARGTVSLLNDDMLEDQTKSESANSLLDFSHEAPSGGCSNFVKALRIPGVLEFAFALFFAKFVAYMFIYWLPYYLGHLKFTTTEAAQLSTAFDVGGIIGGIFAGWLSDRIGRRSPVAFMYLILSVPALFFYRSLSAEIGDSSIALNVVLMLVCGAFVNGPYALITTAVSADLGSHPSLQGDLSLTATVTGIIDGTGSIGASIQGVLIGIVASGCNASGQSWNAVFFLLMICCALSALMLTRLVIKEGPAPGSCRSVYRIIVVVFLIALASAAGYSTYRVAVACGPSEGCTNLN